MILDFCFEDDCSVDEAETCGCMPINADSTTSSGPARKTEGDGVFGKEAGSSVAKVSLEP